MDDETPFARAVIQCAFRRPAGFPPPREVELHTQLPRKVPLGNHLGSVRQSVLDVLRPGQHVRHVVWEKLEERIVLAGEFTQTTAGNEHSPRWGVHMGHIARGNDPRGASHEWKKLNDERVAHWFRRFGTRNAPQHEASDLIG